MNQLYAQDRWSVLLTCQATDAAGKDGAIKHAPWVIEDLGSLELHYPRVDEARQQELVAARAELMREDRGARAPRRGG